MSIVIPKAVKKKTGDSVAYEYRPNNGTFTNQDAICYHSVMTSLPNLEILCKPHGGSSYLPDDDFLKFFDLCRKNGVGSLDITAYVDEGKQYLHIPYSDHCYGTKLTKHKVYAALCCYRWCDSTAPMIYELLRLLEQKPFLNFFQALHYVCGKYTTRAGGDQIHSFYCVTADQPSVYNKFSWQNVALSAVLPKFFKENDTTVNQTCMILSNRSAKVNPAAGRQMRHMLKKQEEILDERFVPLYDEPTAAKLEESFK